MALIVQYDITHDGSIYELQFLTSHKLDWKQQAEPFIAVMKAFIPISHREYNNRSKTWEIAKEYFMAIEMVAKQINVRLQQKVHFTHDESGRPKVKVSDEFVKNFFYEAPPPITTKPVVDLKKSLEVMLGIKITTQPIDELKKLYRRKAMELHPDRNGGDTSRMSELNSVWSEYTR